MRWRMGIFFFALLSCRAAFGEMLCVNEEVVFLRSSPGSSHVVLEVPRNYPLQVVARGDDYVQVSDYLDRRGWVERSEVSPGRCVVVERDGLWKLMNFKED